MKGVRVKCGKEAVAAFYADLYGKRATDRASQRELLTHIRRVVSYSEGALLEAPITREEFNKVLAKGGGTRTAPGPDGLYKAVWSVIPECRELLLGEVQRWEREGVSVDEKESLICMLKKEKAEVEDPSVLLIARYISGFREKTISFSQ